MDGKGTTCLCPSVEELGSHCGCVRTSDCELIHGMNCASYVINDLKEWLEVLSVGIHFALFEATHGSVGYDCGS